MKAISSIFSSLIVTIITLSIAFPLFLYFNTIYSINSGIIGQNFNKIDNALETKLSLISLGDNTNSIYLYNYGNSNVFINLIIINNKSYKTSITIKPNEIIQLSKIINNSIILHNSTIIIEANGNYYYYT